jgi:hypothetical protein
LVYMKPCMPAEPKYKIRALAEAGKASIYLRAELSAARRCRITQVLFDVAMASLFGVQIRGIRREPRHPDLGVLSEVFLDDGCPMCRRAPQLGQGGGEIGRQPPRLPLPRGLGPTTCTRTARSWHRQTQSKATAGPGVRGQSRNRQPP